MSLRHEARFGVAKKTAESNLFTPFSEQSIAPPIGVITPVIRAIYRGPMSIGSETTPGVEVGRPGDGPARLCGGDRACGLSLGIAAGGELCYLEDGTSYLLS